MFYFYPLYIINFPPTLWIFDFRHLVYCLVFLGLLFVYWISPLIWFFIVYIFICMLIIYVDWYIFVFHHSNWYYFDITSYYQQVCDLLFKMFLFNFTYKHNLFMNFKYILTKKFFFANQVYATCRKL